jgi:hypothetical protein
MRGRRSWSRGILSAAVATAALAACTASPAPRPPVFATPQPSASSVHFTASGDFSFSAAAGAVLAHIAESGADLHLALGDLSYSRPGEEGAWCDFVTRHVGEDFPFELLAGNHEADGQNGHIDAFTACLPNRLPGLVGQYAREYFVDVPSEVPLVRLILISPGVRFDDGVWSYAEGSSRYGWTEAAIDDARESGIQWVVVGMHMPCLSVGRYSCGSGPDVMKLLVDKRVDLVLSGHEHTYQRTHQLATGSDCPELSPVGFDAECVGDSDGTFDQGTGTVFATVGTGGVELRDINRRDPEWGYLAAAAGANVLPTWGSLDVRVTRDRLTARFDRALGDQLTDSFTISAH